MRCDEVVELLMWNDPNRSHQPEELREHLENCAACAHEYRDIAALLAISRTASPPVLSVGNERASRTPRMVPWILAAAGILGAFVWPRTEPPQPEATPKDSHHKALPVGPSQESDSMASGELRPLSLVKSTLTQTHIQIHRHREVRIQNQVDVVHGPTSNRR